MIAAGWKRQHNLTERADVHHMGQHTAGLRGCSRRRYSPGEFQVQKRVLTRSRDRYFLRSRARSPCMLHSRVPIRPRRSGRGPCQSRGWRRSIPLRHYPDRCGEADPEGAGNNGTRHSSERLSTGPAGGIRGACTTDICDGARDDQGAVQKLWVFEL